MPRGAACRARATGRAPGCRRRARRSRSRGVPAAATAGSRGAAPEVVEVEPVEGRVARAILKAARVGRHAFTHRAIASLAVHGVERGEIGERLEADLVAIAAAIESR